MKIFAVAMLGIKSHNKYGCNIIAIMKNHQGRLVMLQRGEAIPNNILIIFQIL